MSPAPVGHILDDKARCHSNCKICTMIARSEELGKLIYSLKYEERMPLRAIASTMKPIVEGWNKDHPKDSPLETFSFRAVATHFTKHTNMAGAMAQQVQSKLFTTPGLGTDTLPVTKQEVQVAVSRAISVFDEMVDLFNKLKRHYDEYERDKPKIGPLTMHLDIIREIRKTLTEIARIRQSKELIKIAVRSVVDTFLSGFIDESGRHIESLRSDLLKRVPDRVLVDALIEEFRKSMVNSIVESSKLAVNRVRNEFALDSTAPED